MSYTKPRLVIDNRLGEAYIENVKKIGSDIAQTVTSTVQQAKAKRDANFKITREIDNYQSQLELGLAKVAIENKVDVNSFLSGQKAAASEFKQRNLRLSWHCRLSYQQTKHLASLVCHCGIHFL